MPQDPISSSSSMPPASHIPPLYSARPAHYPPAPALATHYPPSTGRPVPTISVYQAQANIGPEPLRTPNNVTHSPAEPAVHRSPSVASSGSPSSPMVMSTTATPVVPPSASHPQRNPFPLSPSVTVGSKRTASGTVKAPDLTSASVPTSPAAPTTPRMARSQTSMDASPGRNVSQLSSQLRARLTYALLKVQNNWTTESLDQVEARVSQGQYPTSPSTRIRIKREPSSEEQAGNFRRQRTASEPNTVHPLSRNTVASGEPSGRTYESFWAEHEPNPIAKKILLAKAASAALGSTTGMIMPESVHLSARGGLQPPAQIVPDRARRTPYNPLRQPPKLPQGGSSGYSNASTIPNTPPSSHAGTAALEQDAVESLMFLSSPGNSRHMGPKIDHAVISGAASGLLQPSEAARHNYGRNATTWPTGRHRTKQARTSLEGISMLDSGVVVDEDLTEVEEDTAGSSQETVVQPAAMSSPKTTRVENCLVGTVTRDRECIERERPRSDIMGLLSSPR